MDQDKRFDELAKAVYYGKVGLVIKEFSVWPDVPVNRRLEQNHGQTLLHIAAGEGHIRLAGFLIENGAQLDATDDYENTPLHLAALNNCKEVVALLKVAGADMDLKNKDGKVPEELLTDKSYKKEFMGLDYARSKMEAKGKLMGGYKPLLNEVYVTVNRAGDDESKRKTINARSDYNGEDLKAIVEVVLGVPMQEQQLRHARTNLIIKDDTQIDSIGLEENDRLIVEKVPEVPQMQQFQQQNEMNQGSTNGLPRMRLIPGTNLPFGASVAELYDYFNGKGDEHVMEFAQHFPEVAVAIKEHDMDRIASAWQERKLQIQMDFLNRGIGSHSAPRQQQLDPNSKEGQQLMFERARMQNVGKDLETVIEHFPETMSSIHMLYVRFNLNDKVIVGLVDTGAQQTIMKKSVAEHCGLLPHLDTRMQGVIQGIGSAKIIGKVHLAYFVFGNFEIPCSFVIVEDESMNTIHGADFIFGLDMMRRHECEIVLKRDKMSMVFGGTFETPFLNESEIDQMIKKEMRQ